MPPLADIFDRLVRRNDCMFRETGDDEDLTRVELRAKSADLFPKKTLSNDDVEEVGLVVRSHCSEEASDPSCK